MKNTLLILVLIGLSLLAGAQGIIPCPNQYKTLPGNIHIPKTLTIETDDRPFDGLIPQIILEYRDFCGLKVIKVGENAWIKLVESNAIKEPEAYRLTVGTGGITIEAGTPAGCFYGLQSLLQMLNSAGPSAKLKCAVVDDKPRFAWRGVMLDESRHFFGMAEVKKVLDFMAFHKLNKFHWHLTDVPGWRIEIKQYPLLTSVGAVGNHNDPNAPACFYTQKEIKEMVEYARQRFIEIIPEIDMPGHATSAVKAYPAFSGGGSKQYPDFTFHPAKEGTYTFLTNILREITGLFPSRYIHIGGDEVSFGSAQWVSFPEIQKLMAEHHLKNPEEIEHYFLNRMADSIRTIGKTAIGWDEVVTASLNPDNTVVMWWRHNKPEMLQEALDKNYQVIMCPRIPLYFDFVQKGNHIYGRKWAGGEFAPLKSVYRFPSEQFTSGVKISTPLIQGIQANLWTENIHTPERLEFMLFPRISALAESAWTNDGQKNYAGFLKRMKPMEKLYRLHGIRYCRSARHPGNFEIAGPVKK